MTHPASPGQVSERYLDRWRAIQQTLFYFAVGFIVLAALMLIEGRTSYCVCFSALTLCCIGGMIVNLVGRLYKGWRGRRQPSELTSRRRPPESPGQVPDSASSSGSGAPERPDLRGTRPGRPDDLWRTWQSGEPARSGGQEFPEETPARLGQYYGAEDERGALVPQVNHAVPATAAPGSRQPAREVTWNPVTVPAEHGGMPALPHATRDETPPALPFQMGRMAEPMVFDHSSTAGKAPWLLPAGNAVLQTGLAADGVRLGDLEVRAATMVGADHRCGHPAKPRQDAYSLAQTQDGQYLLAAVADGVSNSRHSDLGARVAASKMTRELSAIISGTGRWPANVADLATSIARDMAGTAKGRGISEDEVQCVLAAVAIPARANLDGRRKLWVAWIGDVSIWLRQGGDLHRITGEEKQGPDPNALSTTLPFHPHEMRVGSCEAEPGDSVIVMTDGLSDSLDMVAGVREYFVSQWSERPPHPAAFLYSLCYDAPGQTDDRTAVVTWCGGRAQDGSR